MSWLQLYRNNVTLWRNINLVSQKYVFSPQKIRQLKFEYWCWTNNTYIFFLVMDVQNSWIFLGFSPLSAQKSTRTLVSICKFMQCWQHPSTERESAVGFPPTLSPPVLTHWIVDKPHSSRDGSLLQEHAKCFEGALDCWVPWYWGVLWVTQPYWRKNVSQPCMREYQLSQIFC